MIFFGYPRLKIFHQLQNSRRIAELLGVAGTDVPVAEIEKLVPSYKVPFSPPALYLSPAWCEWVQLCGEQQWLRPLPPGPEAYGEWTPQLPCSFLPLGHYEHSYIQRVPFPSNKKNPQNYGFLHNFFQFQEILKPNYNSVDLAEVEVVHDPNYDEPRHNDTKLLRVGSSVNLI